MTLADGPHCLISRMRVYLGGACIEVLDFYGRSHYLYRERLMGKEWVENEAVESGCEAYQEGAANSVLPNIAQAPIASGKYTTFSLTPLLGVLSCGK